MPRELWRECVFLLAGRRRETLTVRWPAGTFVVSTRDLDVSRRTFVAGPYGLERLLRAGELVAVRGREVLEVGANIGTTTIPLVTLLGAARVHAFEPVARNFALLERNVELNGLGERVALHRAAVSEREGTVALSVPERFWGSSRVGPAAAGSQPAPCVTIDALIAGRALDAARIALVWIDVEGHEAAVLSGASALAAVPLVLEHDPAQQRDLARLHRLIAARAGPIYDLADGAPLTLAELGDAPRDILVLPAASAQ